MPNILPFDERRIPLTKTVKRKFWVQANAEVDEILKKYNDSSRKADKPTLNNKLVYSSILIYSDEKFLFLTAKYFKLEVSNIIGKRRDGDYPVIRFYMMDWLRWNTTYGLKSIGKLLGGRDHSTVINGINVLQDLCDTDILIKATKEKYFEYLKNNM